MFDQAHSAEVGHSRASLWDVHPVTVVVVIQSSLRAQVPTPQTTAVVGNH